jgi:RND family efflux transporter MFP subunit
MKQLTTQILRRRFKRLVFLFLMGLFLFQPLACKKKENKYVPPPPPKVTVMLPEIQDVTVYLHMTGRTAAINKVDIVARVRGYLEKIYFKDGEIVKKGQLLFTIDPREYIATLHKSEADLLNAKSSLNFAKNDLDRREKAYRKKAVSELDYLRAKAEYDKAKAAVAAAEANVEEAKLNLSYTRIHAPITGKTSRHLIDAGNLVGASGPTVLTTVVSLNPIYAYFNINERAVARYLRKVAMEGKRKGKIHPRKTVPVDLALATEEGYSHKGKLDYVDNRVDPNTGTLQARAVFSNENITIVPGFFAKIRIPDRVEKNALLVPERAIGLDQVGRYLYVVGPDNKVVRKDIKLGPAFDTMRVVEKGLEKDARVIIEGILRARPGLKVQPVVAKKEETPKNPKENEIKDKPAQPANKSKTSSGKG